MTGAGRADRILAIHPGALGDVLQAVPALRALRGSDGTARVTFAGQPRLGHLLAGTGAVDEALPFDGLGVWALFAPEPLPAAVRARLARFDRAISWFGSRAAPYPDQLRAAVRDVLLAPPVPAAGGPPVWQHLLATVAPWPCAIRCLTPLAVPAAWQEEAHRALTRLLPADDRPLLVVHPGAGGAWKRWAPDRFAAVLEVLARRTRASVVVHQGPADAQAVAGLEQALGAALPRIVEPDLPVLAGVLAGAGAYVGSDSGVSHLAASAGAPAVILCPPVTHQLWAPWSPTAVVVEAGGERDQPGAVAALLAERLARAGPRRLPTC